MRKERLEIGVFAAAENETRPDRLDETPADRPCIRLLSPNVEEDRLDAKLDLWVPHEMQEHYETSRGYYLDGTAEYSEFQRFQVRVRQTPR